MTRSRLLAVALMIPLVACFGSAAERIRYTRIWVETNLDQCYPRLESVFLSGVQQAPKGIGLVFHLRSDCPDFDHFLCARNGAGAEPIKVNEIEVSFQRDGQPRQQTQEITVQAVSRDGKKSESRTILVTFSPAEFYAASAKVERDSVCVSRCDLPTQPLGVRDFLPPPAMKEDVEFAQKTWGKLVGAEKGDLARARALAQAIVTKLAAHRGVPSDDMCRAEPFDQWRLALAGKSKAWCSNDATIFLHACRCLDIPARRISMQNSTRNKGKFDWYLAEGHISSEIFDRQANRWIWIDLTMGILGVQRGERPPLSIAEVMTGINDPDRAAELTFAELSEDGKELRRVGWGKSAKRDLMKRFLHRDQKISFFRRKDLVP